MNYRGKYEALAVPMLPIASIDIPDHHRPVGELVVQDLMVSMVLEGILQPIGVRVHPAEADRFILVFGRQRLEAMERLGNETIPSVILDLDADEAGRANDAENVFRTDYIGVRAHEFRVSYLHSCYRNLYSRRWKTEYGKSIRWNAL